MIKYEVKTRYVKDRTYVAQTGPFPISVDFEEKEHPGSSQYFLSSLAACKLVALLELRAKHRMQIEEAEVVVSGDIGRGEPIEGTRFPSSRIVRIDFLFRLKTHHSEAELWEYLKFVNGACTVGNSISEKIEQNYRFERI